MRTIKCFFQSCKETIEIEADVYDIPGSPFNDARHPEHKNYVEAMSRLYQAEADLGKQPEDPE